MARFSFDNQQKFEWDENKNEINYKKHNIDFEDAALVLLGPCLRKRSDQNDEIRYLAIGYMEDIGMAIIYTMRGDVCRIISARHARKIEKEEYHHQENSSGTEKGPHRP